MPLGSGEHASPSVSDEILTHRVLDYKICSSLGIAMRGELHEQSISDLTQAIIQVVEIEGPIHINEVARRIRSL